MITQKEFYEVEETVREEQSGGTGDWYDVDYLIDAVGWVFDRNKKAGLTTLVLTPDAALHLRHILEVTEGEHVAGMLEQLQDPNKFETADFTAHYIDGAIDISMKDSNPFYGGNSQGSSVASRSEARNVQAQLQAISEWDAEKRK